jgi:hypothetical protein
VEAHRPVQTDADPGYDSSSMKHRKEKHRLAKKHGWSARPGCKIFVADRGALRFDYPAEWVVLPDPDSIKFRDQEPPDDDCVLAVSYMRIPIIDWTGMPLSYLVTEATKGDQRSIQGWDPVVESRRADMEIAWRQGRFVDQVIGGDALTRLCLARRLDVQALLTMDCWQQDEARFGPIWDLVLDTLVLAEPIQNPMLGPQVM